MNPTTHYPQRPSSWVIAWPFITVVVLLAALGLFSFQALSAMRAYVAGESLWSKCQKDAIYYLSLYADTRDEQLYRQYQQALQVPEGGHALRLALDQPVADIAAAREGLAKGGNHPDDFDGVIWFFQTFRHFSYFAHAIDQWTVGDAWLSRLNDLAQAMHRSIQSGSASATDVVRWKREIYSINQGVTPVATGFSMALGEGARFLLRLVILVNVFTALMLIALALWITRRLMAQRHAIAEALQAEQDRARVTLASIGDGVIATDAQGAITYMNPAAELLTQWKADHATGLPLASLFNLLEESGDAGPSLAERIRNGQFPVGPEPARLIQRLDGSTVVVALNGAPLASERRGGGTVLVLHDMTQERQYIANLAWQATHDALTGLANRREFEFRLEQALNGLCEPSVQHSLLFLDLDQFKLVNDTCGHAAGDELLRHVCALLQSAMNEGDTLARLGGDEFGVLLERCTAERAEQVAEQLRERVQRLHFVWRGRPFMATLSVGMVQLNHSGMTLEEALRAADLACYMAKEKGRNRVQRYHEDDLELSLRHGEMAWVQRLRQALEEDRFRLYAQAIERIGPSGETRGHVEILLRLSDEQGRLILPAQFIPAAERFGLMPELDRWVVRNVFKVLRQCLDEGGKVPMAVCAINLSGLSLGDEGFLDYLRQQMQLYRIPPVQLCFEITETSAIANLSKAITFIEELKALGCEFSLDDFCAGMSSFGYLKHLPVDYLKIDGSFVRDMLDDPVNRAMVEVMNHIGHVMGKKTIAEFVETPLIHQALREIGVDYAQGYLIERPQPLTCEGLRRLPLPQPSLEVPGV